MEVNFGYAQLDDGLRYCRVEMEASSHVGEEFRWLHAVLGDGSVIQGTVITNRTLSW